MMKFLFLSAFALLLFPAQLWSAETVINGLAPRYVGQKVELYVIDDYLSKHETLVSTTFVRSDSTFSLHFENNLIRKVIIKSNNNKGFIYVQPHAVYSVFLPDRNRYDEYRPLGNDVEIAFFDLPETDINYKILSFDKWYTDFLGWYFNKKSLQSIEFMAQLDTFKMNVHKAYETDTNFFFRTYVRYSLANLDNMPYLGARNRFEKYDFYLRDYPMAYDNPVYMEYVSDFYTNINDHLPLETNNRIYIGIEKRSPTLIINAMRREPTLSNVRLREFAMIRLLSDYYFDANYKAADVKAVLDSLANNALFKEHRVIARNVINKFSEINSGSKAPELMLLKSDHSTLTNKDLLKKHVYLQFIDLSMQESQREVDALIPLAEKYKDYVNFITIYKRQGELTAKQKAMLSKITWQIFEVSGEDPVWKNYGVMTFPYYVLIDHYGYVVNAPAMRPTPNGQYETIDRSFFYIQKYIDEERKNEH